MSQAQKLEEIITKSVIPDLNERLDEIYEEIAGSKEATEDAKEEIEELQDFKADLQDVLDDIASGDIDEDECEELINDILEAQRGSEEEDFGFMEEEPEPLDIQNKENTQIRIKSFFAVRKNAIRWRLNHQSFTL